MESLKRMPKDILNEAIKLQTLLEQYDSKTVSGFNLTLTNTLDKTIANIARLGDKTIGRAKLNALLAETVLLIRDQYTDFNSWLLKDQKDVAKVAYQLSAAAYATYEIAGITSFTKLPEAAVKRILDPNRYILGSTMKDYESGLMDKQIRDFKQIIADGVATGDSTQSIANELLAKGDILRRNAKTITNTVIGNAQQEAYTEGARQFDSIIAYAFSEGILDGRTSPICQHYTGTSWRRKKGESLSDFIARIPDKPKRHFNCRSQLIYQTSEQHSEMKDESKPSVVDADERTVNHRDGSTSTAYRNKKVEFVQANTTYDEFFNAQSDKFKIGVLGQERFDLYKSGKLDVSQVRDVRSNSYKTIDEIEELIKS